MAYIGLAPVTNFLTTFSETFSGTGAQYQFILSRAVSRAEDLEVFIGTAQQLPNLYTATGTELTFITAPTAGSDNITVIYRAGALQSLSSGVTTFAAGTAAAPSVAFTNSLNSGLFFPSSSQLAVTLGGTKRAQFDSATSATSTTTGALQVLGGIGLTGNLYAGGVVRITDTTESASSGTGALVVSGGLGVAKDFNVTGDIQCQGDFTVGGTFTTTASDSLAISDPFLFLATNNSGDSIDIGFTGKYIDVATTRYTGLFRDSSEAGTWKLFANLTASPTTVVDTANVSFSYADLTLRSLTSSGILKADGGSEASSTTTGALQVTGGAGITGTVYIGGTLELASGNINTTGFLSNVSGIDAQGTIRTTGRIYANSGIGSTTTATGAVIVTGGMGVSGNINSGNINATGSTLSNLTVSGAITVNSAGLDIAIVNGSTDGVGNIGASNDKFNYVHARATSALYADVAERYTADSQYEPGTVLHFGGDHEVSQCNVDHCTRVAGVVSTAPAYLMNDRLSSEYVVDLALLGRVPTKVTGLVNKGDMMVSAGNGRARAEANPKLGSVIGKALENFDGEVGVIEVVIGRS